MTREAARRALMAACLELRTVDPRADCWRYGLLTPGAECQRVASRVLAELAMALGLEPGPVLPEPTLE